MKTFLFIFLFVPSLLCSQNIEKIKISDTIYVLYNGGKKQEKIEYQKKVSDSIQKSFLYQFSDKNNMKISFFHDTFLNLDDIEINKRALTVEKKYSFIRKNRDLILDIDFFLENGIEQSINLINKKVIFIIDSCNKKRKLLLQESKLSNFYPVE